VRKKKPRGTGVDVGDIVLQKTQRKRRFRISAAEGQKKKTQVAGNMVAARGVGAWNVESEACEVSKVKGGGTGGNKRLGKKGNVKGERPAAPQRSSRKGRHGIGGITTRVRSGGGAGEEGSVCGRFGIS